MTYYIQLGNYKVKHLLDCEVRKSANKLSDTATIQLNGMAYGSALEIESKLKRGDQVTIKLGYKEQAELPTEFTGHISSIQTDNTIEIACEDGMFQFRKDVKNKQYQNVTLVDLVEDIATQIGGFQVVAHPGIEDIRYDKYTIHEATGFDVFQKLVNEDKVHLFIKGKELHVALKFTYKSGEVGYRFGKNVEKANLRYVKEEDKKVLVEVVGIKKDNTKTTVLVGDPGGDKITLHRYNVSDEKALEAIGKEELKLHRYTGYEGDITGWLLPWCTYGYTATIYDPSYPEREGRYYVEAVTTRFNHSGGSRKITVGLKL